MGLPILPHDQRPFIRLKRKSGNFPNGNPTYDPPAEFTLDFDMNKATIMKALVDNTPVVGTARYIDTLTIGDSIIVVMVDTDGTEYALFNGLIQSLEFQGNTNLVELHGIDTSTYGENTFLNSIHHQKFVANEERNLIFDTGNNVGFDYTNLPSDTTTYAPVVSELRQVYGKHLTSALDNLWLHRGQLVYSAPTPSGFALRNVGGVGTVDNTDEPDPDSVTEKAILNGNYYYNKEFLYKDGAKKVVAQVFKAGRDDEITNIFFPICLFMRRYPSQITVAAGGTGTNVIVNGAQAPWYIGNWDQTSSLSPGTYDWHEMVALPTGTAIDTANFGQPYNTFGPGMDLKVTLVRCTRAAKDDNNQGGYTKYTRHVDKKENIPTAVRIEDLGGDYTGGVLWDATTTPSSDPLPFEVVEIMKDINGNDVQITIEPDNPIPAPHYPTGAPIAHNYNIGNDNPNYGSPGSRGNGHEFFMTDEQYADAYTLFGWNLEAAPVSIERNEHYALIFEMLGDENHPKLTDGVDIGGTANPGYLSPACAWGVGLSLQFEGFTNQYNIENPLYTDGEHLKTLNTSGSGSKIGYHGKVAWGTLIRSSPGYSITYAPWDATPLSIDGPSITGANFGHWELEDWLSQSGVYDMDYDFTMEPKVGGPSVALPMANVSSLTLWRGRSDNLTQFFSIVGGGWQVAGENLYWKWDGENKRILWGAGSANFTPVTDIGPVKMSKVSYYTNPTTGGLLRATDASTLRDVFHSLCSRVSSWATIICDGNADGADDAYGTGYNDVNNFELSYWSAVNESAWQSVVRLAQEYDANVWIHTDLNGANTVVFEKKEPIVDFTYNAGSTHQYCYSNRDIDTANLKFLTYTKITQDIENMYTRFRVIGASPDGETGQVIPGLPAPDSTGPPISWILDVPEIEAITGYRKEFTFEAKKNITSFEIAKKAAEALKTIHAVNQYDGTVTLSGCHPIYKNPTLGLMFDRNAIIRIMDKYAVTTDSPTGTANVFRVTGISYNSKDHKTDIKLTTVMENKSYIEAEKLLEQLKKNQQNELDGQKFVQKVDYVSTQFLPVADMTMTPMDSAGTIPGSTDAYPTIVDDVGKWYLVGSFLPGYGTISNDQYPLTRIQVDVPGIGLLTTDLESSVYKWPKDSLTVIVEFTKP